MPAPHCDYSFYVTWHLLCHRIHVHDMCDYSPKSENAVFMKFPMKKKRYVYVMRLVIVQA